MALTNEQREVFMLAVELLECNGIKAMDHSAHTQVQSSAREGQRPAIDWAVDYLKQLDGLRNSHLVRRAHMGAGEWTPMEIRLCGAACRWFYRRVHSRRLYGEGLRYLRIVGG